MAHHHFARTFAGGLLAIASLTAGCDKLPSAPTPSAPPAPPSVGLTVAAVSPTIGPTSVASELRVSGTGFLNGAVVTLGGVAAKVIVVTSTTITAMTMVHPAGTVDVVVTNPDGPSATLASAYTFEVPSVSLNASPSLVTSGDELTIEWVGPRGRDCRGGGDWIAMYKVGDPDDTGAANGHSDLWFVHVCAATSGTSKLRAPNQPGEYEFRFMMGDGAVARSNPVTFRASSSPPSSVPALLIDGGTSSTRQIGETFWVTGSGFTPGGSVTRHIDPPVNGSTVIAPLTADQSGNLTWVFTPTCVNFDPRHPAAIYAVDDATGRISNTINETVTGSCPNAAAFPSTAAVRGRER
jgi:IPT/TIG domain